MTIQQFLANHADGGWYTADEIGAGVNMATSYVEERLDRLADQGIVKWQTFSTNTTPKYQLADSEQGVKAA